MKRTLRLPLGVLEERNVRLFLIGYTTSLIGATMVPVALTFAVLDEGHPLADIGYVLTAETVPLVVLLLLGGVVADRVPRKALMVGTDLVRLTSEGILAGLLLTGSPPLWAFMVLAGVLGAGQAMFNPAMTGLLPELSSPARLQDANALSGVASSAGGIVGPALAGVIVAAGGAGWAVAIDAATYAVSALCLSRLEVPAKVAAAGRTSMLADLATGWREFAARTWLWVVVVQFGLFNLITFPAFLVLGAVVARDHLGGPGAWGVVLAALAAGSVVGGLATIRIRPRRPLVVATVATAIFGLPSVLLAVPVPTPWIAAGAFVAGIGSAVFDTLWSTTLQREVPDAVLSRVSAYDWFGSSALVPVGFALAGPVAGAVGIRTTLLAGAGWVVLTSGLVLLVPAIRAVEGPGAGGSSGLPPDAGPPGEGDRTEVPGGGAVPVPGGG